MNEKRDNIYIYLWEEFNTIYIGRTINPKSRHYTHKHRESERTYQFSSEHHVEHPKMVIIENDLSVEEGVEREKYWIEYYKNNTPYNVLNFTCGGQKGRQIFKLTEEEKKERQREYYQKNKEKIKAYRKKYREEHRKEIRERERKYYEKTKKPHKPKKTKEEIHEYKKRYREEHREEIRLKKKEYYQKNKEKEIAYRKAHQEEIKLKRREYFKKYYQEHKLNN